MKIAIAVDSWKLSIFKKHLKKNGYSFRRNPGLTENTLLLTVNTNDPDRLGEAVVDANTECDIWGRTSNQ